MPNFVCEYCGMMTEKPEIVPINFKAAYDPMIKYVYSITCPVCQNKTRFWRDEPFLADKPLSASSFLNVSEAEARASVQRSIRESVDVGCLLDQATVEELEARLAEFTK